VKPLKVYVSKHRMFDTNHGLILSAIPEVSISISETLLNSLFDGWFEEDFFVQLSTYDAKTLRKLKRLAKMGDDLYFGFWMENGNRLFQVKMMLQKGRRRRKQEIPSSLIFAINGLPEIFPIACSIGTQRSLCS